MRPARLLLCALLPLLWAAAGPLPKPKLKPQRTQAIHAEMIKEGIALTDQGDYERALDKYQHVLEENPDDVNAIYEMAYAYYHKKDYEKCVSTARRGAQYEARNLAQVYQVLGNCLDDAGRAFEAVPVYRAALKRYPSDYLLHYNLALTYLKTKQPRQARWSVRRALLANPDHPSSHLLLGRLYLEEHDRIPALMALSRFLVLEPASRRSPQAQGWLRSIIDGAVKKEGERNYTVMVAIPDKKLIHEEGDFTTADLMLKMSIVAATTEEGKKKLEQNPNAALLDAIRAAFNLVTAGSKRSGFARRYYAPYFAELEDRGFVEPLVYYTWRTAGLRGADEWIQNNHAKVSEFLAWSRKYDWKRAR